MTREQLHNTTGFHIGTIVAVTMYLRANMPRKAVLPEPTALIKNEGRMNGYLDALDDLLAAASPATPEQKKRDFQPYSQPQTENPNRP